MSTPSAPAGRPRPSFTEHLPSLSEAGPLIALVLACAFFISQSNRFLSFQNLSLILQQTMVVAVIAIGQTLILPAGLRQLALISDAGVSALEGEIRELVDDLVGTLGELKEANVVPADLEGIGAAKYARDSQLAAMGKVREVGDQLERVVADDLWPLPKYEEMLFIK